MLSGGGNATTCTHRSFLEKSLLIFFFRGDGKGLRLLPGLEGEPSAVFFLDLFPDMMQMTMRRNYEIHRILFLHSEVLENVV